MSEELTDSPVPIRRKRAPKTPAQQMQANLSRAEAELNRCGATGWRHGVRGEVLEVIEDAMQSIRNAREALSAPKETSS